MNHDQPLVSICCTAYNHANFIREALEGFLMQETDFPFEVLVHDDASTDGTAEIIREYEKRFPGVVKPIYQSINQYSQGKKTSRLNYERARGKYIALCEGDDYWTDCNKLQKQVGFLESNPDYYLCGHAVKQVDEHGRTISESKFGIFEDQDLSAEDMAFGRLSFPTLSVVFRNRAAVPTFKVLNSDTMTFAYFSNFGRGFIFRDVMGVHRVHAGGVWSSRDNRRQADAQLEMLAEIPRIISAPRRSLAYLNFLRHVISVDYNRERAIKNGARAVLGATIHLRRTSVSFLLKEAVSRIVRIPKAKPSRAWPPDTSDHGLATRPLSVSKNSTLR